MNNNEWIDIRKQQPEHGQNCYFQTSITKDVYVGYFIKETNKNGLIGIFRVGCVYDLELFLISGRAGRASDIGFNVWQQNSHEVTYWQPLILPKPYNDLHG